MENNKLTKEKLEKTVNDILSKYVPQEERFTVYCSLDTRSQLQKALKEEATRMTFKPYDNKR